MTILNHITLDALARLPIAEIIGLPATELARLQHEADEALREAELDDLKNSVNDIRSLNPANTIRETLNPLRQMGQEIKSDLERSTPPNGKPAPLDDGYEENSILPDVPLGLGEPPEELKPLAQQPVAPAATAPAATTPARRRPRTSATSNCRWRAPACITSRAMRWACGRSIRRDWSRRFWPPCDWTARSRSATASRRCRCATGCPADVS